MYSENGGGEAETIFIPLKILHHCGYAFFSLIFLQFPDLSPCLVLVGFSSIWNLDLISVAYRLRS
jgi:hypothetical protein